MIYLVFSILGGLGRIIFIKVKYKQSNLSYVKCINIYNISKNINTSSYKITKCEKFGKINLKIFWKMDIYKCPIFEF
jgi:hypothetical protein